jgi:integrase
LKLFRQIMGFAVQHGRLPFNPADVLRARKALPPQTRQGDIRPLDPVEVEAIRTALMARKTPNAVRDATLVSVMAYAGLRPEEALALQWEHIDTGSLRVRQANANGELGPTKTGKPRTIRPLIAPLVGDLEIWRKASGKVTNKALLFPDSNGGLWPEQTYGNWRQRVFKPVAPDDATPYSCRHGYASLLIREGKPLAEVASLMGNSPTQTVSAYTHVMERYENQPSQPMEALVLAARSVRKVSDTPSRPLKAAA